MPTWHLMPQDIRPFLAECRKKVRGNSRVVFMGKPLSAAFCSAVLMFVGQVRKTVCGG